MGNAEAPSDAGDALAHRYVVRHDRAHIGLVGWLRSHWKVRDVELIIVGGMHRSGTSFVTELLHVLGAHTGDDLLIAADDNPHGFFEHRGFKQINDQVLAQIGGAWDRPVASLSPNWPKSAGLDRFRQMAETAVRSLIEEAGDAPACAVKDPRFSLTGPFWASIVAPEISLIPLRDPIKVAESLRHRNGMSPHRAAQLWTRYTVCSILELPRPRIAVLDDLINDPDVAVRQLASATKLDGDPAKVDLAVELAASRQRTLQTTSALTPEFDDEPMRLARSLYEVLRRDFSIHDLTPLLEEIADGWRRTPGLDSKALRSADPADPAASLLEAAAARMAELEAEVERARIETTDVRSERDQARRQLRSIGSDSTAKERHTDSSSSDKDLEHEIAQLRKRLRSSERQFDRLKSRRSVRVALAATAPLRPIVRLGRRARRSRPARPSSSRQGSSDDRSPPAAALPPVSSDTPPWLAIIERLRVSPTVTVVVPFDDGATDVDRCLEQLIRWAPSSCSIVVIDDATTDVALTATLQRYRDVPHLGLERNEAREGLTSCVNRVISRTAGDVVVVSPGARVGPNFLLQLRTAAYSSDRVASAVALSKNGGPYSVPGILASKPTGLAHDEEVRLYGQRSHRRWARGAIGFGACAYLRRDAIDAVGELNAARFPDGGAAQVDWCLRARDRGWDHVVDDATVVAVPDGAQGAAPDAVSPADRQDLEASHPAYTQWLSELIHQAMAAVRADARGIDRAALELSATGSAIRPRVLMVCEAAAIAQTRESALLRQLEPAWDVWALTRGASDAELLQYSDGDLSVVDTTRWSTAANDDGSLATFREFVARHLGGGGYELIQVGDLYDCDVAAVVQALWIPAVFAFAEWSPHRLPGAKHFDGFDRLIASNQSIRSSVVDKLPELEVRHIELVPGLGAASQDEREARSSALALAGEFDSARRRQAPRSEFVDVRVQTNSSGRSPGSAHVRALRRFSHPSIAKHLFVRYGNDSAHAFDKVGPPGTIWIERNGLDPREAHSVLAQQHRSGTRVIVDLDDDLLHEAGLQRQFAKFVPTMRRLVAEASLVTVSTTYLADVVADWTEQRISIVPNHLDEQLWQIDGSLPPRKPETASIDVLYMGTTTHAGDLELVREAFDQLRRSRNSAVRLWVIGGAPVTQREWFDRIPVPEAAREYPYFVPWLRSLADRFDFAIAPLVDNLFNASKSDLKFIEYAALGLPAIFSSAPAYTPSVHDGVNGLLCQNRPEAWFEALVTMCDRDLQDDLRAEACQTLQQRTIGANADAMLGLLGVDTTGS